MKTIKSLRSVPRSTGEVPLTWRVLCIVFIATKRKHVSISKCYIRGFYHWMMQLCPSPTQERGETSSMNSRGISIIMLIKDVNVCSGSYFALVRNEPRFHCKLRLFPGHFSGCYVNNESTEVCNPRRHF